MRASKSKRADSVDTIVEIATGADRVVDAVIPGPLFPTDLRLLRSPALNVAIQICTLYPTLN